MKILDWLALRAIWHEALGDHNRAAVLRAMIADEKDRKTNANA